MSAVLDDGRAVKRDRAGADAQARVEAFDNMASLKARLAKLVAVAIVFLLGVQAWSIYSDRKLLLDGNRAAIIAIAEGARGVLEHYHGLQQKGEMSAEQAQAGARRALQGFVYPGHGADRDYLFITDAGGQTIMHGLNPGMVGVNIFNIGSSGKVDAAKLMQERIAAIKAAGGRLFVEGEFPRPGAKALYPKLNVYLYFEPWGWMFGTGTFLDTLNAEVRQKMLEMAALAVVLTAALLAVAALVARAVLRQIGGEPRDVVEMMRRAAHGDLAQEAGQAPAGSLVHAFSLMSAQLRRLVAQVREETGAMKNDAQRIAENVGEVSRAASHQSEATSSMAAAVEELTVSVTHISDAATQTQQNSEGVAEMCAEGERQVMSASEGMRRIAGAVSEASEKIEGLEERAVQINSIAAAIKEIAGQTNLLALNAAIEAARAGEQGRGFSVVADEVRRLAERTASATVEIEEMVSAVQRETAEATTTMQHALPLVGEGTQLAGQVAASLRRISESANTSLERVREVAHATKEQSAASTAIAQQVESIAQMVEETTAAMGSTSQAADAMRQVAERLDKLVGAFKV